MNRRRFIGFLSALGVCFSAVAQQVLSAGIFRSRYVRPPGALAESKFAAACIGCGQCAQVCPNRCIRFFSISDGVEQANTPYIVPRQKPCILCMKCGDVCPTGALSPIKRDAGQIIAKVRMGKARVDKALCLSYQGKTCGVCYRACPLQDVAIKAGRLEQPIVKDACVGCGICERVCIQLPQAIKVIPRHTLEEATREETVG